MRKEKPHIKSEQVESLNFINMYECAIIVRVYSYSSFAIFI